MTRHGRGEINEDQNDLRCDRLRGNEGGCKAHDSALPGFHLRLYPIPGFWLVPQASNSIDLLSAHPVFCNERRPSTLHTGEDCMRFDAALAAQETLREAEAELGADWDEAIELEETFSSNAGATARDAYEQLLALATRHPGAHQFQAFCIYITWQQVTEETIARHFQTGMTLAEAYLASPDGKDPRHLSHVTELLGSFRAGLGLDEEDDIVVEFRKDTPKGGD